MLLNRSLYKKNLIEIENLFRICFKRDIPKAFLEWRYIDNPAHEFLASVLVHNDRIVSSYSASPCLLLFREKCRKAALSMTTMTHPEFTGKGLFPQLAQELYETMKSTNHSIIMGFPNKNSLWGFTNKLDWHIVYEIPTMHLKITDIKTKFCKSLLADNNSLIRDDQFVRAYQDCISLNNLIHVKKTAEYLRWRYTLHPNNEYKNFAIINKNNQVSSYCIFKRYLIDHIDIVDFQPANLDEAEVLLSHLIQHCTKNRFSAIACWAPRHHFIHSLLLKVGFSNKEPISYFGLRCLNDELDIGFASNFSNWYLQMGDSDVY